MLKAAQEVDRCLKIPSPLQRAKVNVCAQIFTEVTHHLHNLQPNVDARSPPFNYAPLPTDHHLPP
jgi:hypothetical protein